MQVGLWSMGGAWAGRCGASVAWEWRNRTRPGFLELLISGVIFHLLLISGVPNVLVTVNGHQSRPLAGIELAVIRNRTGR